MIKNIEILGWFDVYQYKGIVTKDTETSKLALINVNSILFSKGKYPEPTQLQKEYVNYNYLAESLFSMETEKGTLYFRVISKLKDCWIGYLFNEKREILMESPISDFVLNCDNFYFRIENTVKLQKVNEEVKKYKTNKELRSVLKFDIDYLIFKNFGNISLIKDVLECVRFEEVPLSEKSLEIKKDVSEAYFRYSNGEYTLRELMLYYMGSGYSVDGFMDVFIDVFYGKSEKEIVRLLNGVDIHSFD